MYVLARTRSITILFGALALTMIAGCSAYTSPNAPTTGSGQSTGGTAPNAGPRGPGGMMGRGSTGTTTYSSAGQRIFLTGVGVDGQPIPRSAPPVSRGSLMMGGGGCASCHGPAGRGGTIRMMGGTAIEAPDITYSALSKEGFTDATIRNAIQAGTDESGEPLKVAMPRWQMSDADLNATIAYLKVLSAQ